MHAGGGRFESDWLHQWKRGARRRKGKQEERARKSGDESVSLNLAIDLGKKI